MQRFPFVLPLVVTAALLLPGCLGGQERTEWAYDLTGLDGTGRTGTGVTIAVLDTGVDVKHPSLDHLVDGRDENGELVAYRDFVSASPEGAQNARDVDGHGSHVTGIMAARGSGTGDKLLYGGVDLKGASPGARFVVARVCTGETCPGDIAAAIDWAVGEGADILSLSLGGTAALSALGPLVQNTLTEAVNRAIDAGVVVVAAAGNEGERCEGDDADDEPEATDVSTPANIPGVIAVGAVERDGRVWCGSSRGMDDGPNTCIALLPGLPELGRCDPDKKPELVAPGVTILSAWADGKYAQATGTSQATPFVSSAVALMLEGKPDLQGRADVEAVKVVLEETAKKASNQRTPHDEAYGYGLLQADEALERYG